MSDSRQAHAGRRDRRDHASMFDVDAFLDDCIRANHEDKPQLAIKELLERAMSDPGAIADALPPERAEITPLHRSPQLTVLKVVWTPGMTFQPHNHAMWASIGIYTGGEDNEFFRRDRLGLVPSGGKSLQVGDTVVLGGDVIHAVTNPTKQHAGAIHIYGGDLFEAVRSEWDPETFAEQRYDVPAAIRYFEDQNQLFESPPAPS
jgi:predicted metal-dependent enzyme (double-stranded beta helix superfamily)